MKAWIGIDPGEKGAVGIIEAIGGDVKVIDCPDTLAELARIIHGIKEIYWERFVFMEKVNPFHKSSAKSAFTFGENNAAWKMGFAMVKTPIHFVTPRKWQALVYDSAKKLDNPKKQSYELAIRLFPDLELKTKRGKILDGRTDAILIAEYCRRVNQ